MKTISLLPIVLTGIVGGVFLIQIHTVPTSISVSPSARGQVEAVNAPTKTESPAATAPLTVRPAPEFRHEPALLCIPGRIKANRELDIKSKTSGQVLTVAVDVGDTVKPGQLLVELDATDATRSVQRAEATLAASRARLAQARDNLDIAQMSLSALQTRAGACVKSASAKATRARSRADRYKATMLKNVISQETYEEAEAGAVEAAANLELSRVQLFDVKTQERSLELRREDVSCAEAQVTIDEITLKDAQQRLAETKIHACMEGTVTARFVQPGQIVSAGSSSAETRLLTILDFSRVFVTASASASQFGQLKVDQAATIRTEACPDTTFTGKVVRVSPRAAGTDVTFDVKIEVLSENRTQLKSEMPACVEIAPLSH